MIESACYIAQGRKVVLTIKNVSEPSFDKKEVGDLNRGRTYLRDVAEQHNIPIYNSIEDAVHYIIGLETNIRLNK